MKRTTLPVLFILASILAGCGGPFFVYTEFEDYGPEETITIDLIDPVEPDQAQQLIEMFKSITPIKAHTTIQMNEPKRTTSFTLAPVTNVQAFAQALDGGVVESIDGRTILLRVEERP